MIRGHPILHLSPTEELQFVKHADEATLSRFFTDAASTNWGAAHDAADLARKKISEVR